MECFYLFYTTKEPRKFKKVRVKCQSRDQKSTSLSWKSLAKSGLDIGKVV